MNTRVKQSADSKFYAPSIHELQNANKNSKLVANVLLAALGLSTAGYATKYLMEGLAASKLNSEITPDVKLQKRLRSMDSPIANTYLYYTDDESDRHLSDDEVDELLENVTEAKTASLNKQALPVEVNLIKVFNTTPKKRGVEQSTVDWLLNRQNANFSREPQTIDLSKVVDKHSDLVDKIRYNPKTLKSDDLWTQYIGNNLAKLGPQSILPLSVLLGGGLVAAPMLAKAIVKRTASKLPKQEHYSEFVDTAKKIYDDAAEELQDAGYKKEKDKLKEKEAKYKKKDGTITAARVADGSLLSSANIPTLAIAALLSYAAYKGMRGFDTGLERAKNDLSHQTQFLRGWRATSRLRDYDYNPMSASLAEEPGLKERLEKEQDSKVKALLEDLQDSEDIQFNPIEIQRLTADYKDLA